MSEYIKLEDAIHAMAENMAQEANLKEHCNEPTFCAGEFLVEAEMLVENLPTIEVSEDLISRQDALDAIAKFVPYVIDDMSTESYTNGLKDAYNLIYQLPVRESDTE